MTRLNVLTSKEYLTMQITVLISEELIPDATLSSTLVVNAESYELEV